MKIDWNKTIQQMSTAQTDGFNNAKKIRVLYIPTELKARYGYNSMGGDTPDVHGWQFDPFNDIAQGRMSDILTGQEEIL